VSSNAIIINIATVFRLLIRDYEEKYLTAFWIEMYIISVLNHTWGWQSHCHLCTERVENVGALMSHKSMGLPGTL
jgi:hypothetical protein